MSVAAVINLPEPSTDGPVTTRLTAELESAGRSDTSVGQAALQLARRIDAGHDHGGAITQLALGMDKLRDKALDGVIPVDDIVDELKRRREHNLSA